MLLQPHVEASLNKQKFIDLNENRKFIAKLIMLYPNCKHDNANNVGDNVVTYGEMMNNGFDTIMAVFKEYNITSFIDVGCGRGKICLYASRLPYIEKVIGIDIVKERIVDAMKLKNDLSEFPHTNKVQFIHGDFMNFDSTQHDISTPLVWVSNLCFKPHVTDKIFSKIVAEFPIRTLIICSKEHNFNDLRIKFLFDLWVPMSWSPNGTTVYCYIIT